MRAWQVQGTGEPVEVLRLVEVDLPTPGPGQLRVRVRAAGIGLPDVFMCRGSYPLTPALPFSPGQEVTGTVTAVGDGTRARVGDEIMGVTAFYLGHGSFAEECLIEDTNAFPVPAGLGAAEAAGFWIPHLTAWTGLVERAGTAAGERLVVLGAAGGSGTAAVQLGRALGADVLGVVGDEAKARLCRDLGAGGVLVQGDEPVAPRVREVFDGGADVVYDPFGGALAEDVITALRRNGRFLAVGFASGRWPTVHPHDLVVANTSFVGVLAGGRSRAELDGVHAELSALVAAGRLGGAVTTTVSFDSLPEAVQRLADRAAVGKHVVVVDEG